jgi:hypothetical protein
VAASSGAPQHLGNRGPRGLLEVRGLAASGERESRLVSAPGFQLVSPTARFVRKGVAIGCHSSGSNA